jgi:hypothetical protein
VAAALPGMDSSENKPPEDSEFHFTLFIILVAFSALLLQQISFCILVRKNIFCVRKGIFNYFCFSLKSSFIINSLRIKVQEVVLKDSPNEVKGDPEGGCAC